ncbi:hypothetical protein [Longitalea luteola]|uniref:hypothetical protein n=1 Tax=Longitalea luteola TaxID=2812563 RepID=UPI001A96D5C6|nr:hypothetical protein [Longitalea luteola]
MKKIFTLIAVLFSITTFAAPGPKASKITFSNNYRVTKVQIKIDGTVYNLDNTFVMDNIRPGNHTITIYKTEQSGFRKRTEVMYNSTMYVSPAQLINVDINRNGKVVVKSSSTDKFDRNGRNNRNERSGYLYDNDRNNNGRDNRW